MMRHVLLGVVLLSIASCSSSDRESALDAACVVTAHPLATAAAAEVLRDGGNAVDASITAAFALSVVEPYSSGLGGGGFFVLHDALTGQQASLDAREIAPAAARRDMFLRDGVVCPELSEDGALSVAVPSLVKGLVELHAAHGSLPWDRLVQPAIDLAEQGFSVNDELHERILVHADRFDAAAGKIFMPGGRPLEVGDQFVQTDLAATLIHIRDRGARGFHEGPIAEMIVDAVAAGGGIMQAEDLRGVQPIWRKPVYGHFRRWDVVGMPPPSSGGVLVQQLLEFAAGWDLESFSEADRLHHLAEAMKFVYADRSRWFGDPDHVVVPAEELMSPSRIDSLRALIHAESALSSQEIGGIQTIPLESEDTTHLSVVDADGNAVAATLTINLGFGSGMVAAGTGVVLNDEMDDFAAAPGVPNAFGLVGGEANAVAPGKRPLSSMSPTIILESGHVVLVAGSPGGSRIITATFQTILNALVLGMDAEAAVSAPRIHHQWYPPVLYEEDRALDAAVRAELVLRGHEFRQRQAIGNVQLILVDPKSRLPVGASDPRGQGSAMIIDREDIQH